MTGPSRTTSEQWTTRGLLQWISARFSRAGLDSPRLLAEQLVAHAIGCDRLHLYTEADRPASPIERDLLRDLVARALDDEPVQYLVGEGWFFSLPFNVDRRVFIPQPATETLVEHVLQHARAEPGFRAANLIDVCTGSGCIAISILKQLPEARAAAVDISPDALEVARTNADRHDVADRLDLLQGDLLEPLRRHPSGHEAHYLLSNPPYIPDDEWDDPKMMDPGVKNYVPEIALRGGPDGLRFVRPLIEHAHEHLRAGGVLGVEVAASRAEQVLDLARQQEYLRDARILEDLDGLPRVLIAHRA